MHAPSVHLSRKTTRSSRRHFLLGLVAAGLAYAAPTLTGLDEAQAHSHRTRRTRRTRYTAHTRYTRRSRYSRYDDYPARHDRGYRDDRRMDTGGFRRD